MHCKHSNMYLLSETVQFSQKHERSMTRTLMLHGHGDRRGQPHILAILPEPEFIPCRRHLGPHVHASLLCRLLLVLPLPRPCRLTSNLELWCQSSSISVFRVFFWCSMSPFAIVWLALVFCRPPRSTCPRHLSLLSLMMWSILCSFV